MSRLIDADALMDNISNMAVTADMTTSMAIDMACLWIKHAPSVEAIEIGKPFCIHGYEIEITKGWNEIPWVEIRRKD